MSDQAQNSKKSIMINYGLLLGFASIIVGLINYVFGNLYEPHWSIMVLSLLVTVTIIVLGLIKVKEMNSGFLGVGESIKVGLGISLVAAIINMVYLVIFYNFIEPEFFNNMIAFQEQMIMEKYPNMSDEQIEGAKKGAAMFASAGANLTMTLIISLFFGLIISLISGLIMKKTEEA